MYYINFPFLTLEILNMGIPSENTILRHSIYLLPVKCVLDTAWSKSAGAGYGDMFMMILNWSRNLSQDLSK